MFFFIKKLFVFSPRPFAILLLSGFFLFQAIPIVYGSIIPDVRLNYEIPGVKGQRTETDSTGKTTTILDVSSIQSLQDNFIKPFFNTLFGIGGIIAVMGIALGGLQYMGAGASIGNVKEGQAKIFNAILGVVLLLSSFLLLRTINPQILGGVGLEKKCDSAFTSKDPDQVAKNSLCPIPEITQSDVKVNPAAIISSAGDQVDPRTGALLGTTPTSTNPQDTRNKMNELNKEIAALKKAREELSNSQHDFLSPLGGKDDAYLKSSTDVPIQLAAFLRAIPNSSNGVSVWNQPGKGNMIKWANGKTQIIDNSVLSAIIAYSGREFKILDNSIKKASDEILKLEKKLRGTPIKEGKNAPPGAQ